MLLLHLVMMEMVMAHLVNSVTKTMASPVVRFCIKNMIAKGFHHSALIVLSGSLMENLESKRSSDSLEKILSLVYFSL